MRYRDDASLDSGGVQDRRGGGRRAVAVGGGGLGLVGVLVLVLLQVLGGTGDGGAPGAGSSSYVDGVGGAGRGGSTGAQELAASCRTGADANARTECALVADVESVQDYWAGVLGERYVPAETVFFSGATDTACGAASSGTGPFYCPADQLAYVDLSFFDELRTRFGAEGGAFVNAYVLAHEYGHHVQHLLGTTAAVRPGESGPDSGSVRLELQADCYAGTWASHATTVPDDSGAPLIAEITDDDVARALDTAGRIGDDFIQTQLGDGTADPGSYTHGTSEQRRLWFTTGYETGDPARCDTFAVDDLG
ncbi:KPN_02809 family neutral zinc metallopeptidase [Kineococcus sp. SYSU DK005]|uniref:KPN_02809 family neutral zinc metallopeptidase n=1 Tax=Kineococcus sp. SYSU DK005 TaxID=3383126 RepID=UPI003D7EE19A